MTTRYINSSSTGGDGTTNNESGATAAYASWSSFVSSEFPVTATDAWTVYFDSGSSDADDTTAVISNGFAGSSTYTLTYIANTASANNTPGTNHGTTWNDQYYQLAPASTSNVLRIQDPNTYIKNLQIDCNWSNAFDNAATVRLENFDDIRLIGCKVKYTGGGSYGICILSEASSTNVHKIWNTLVYDFPSAGMKFSGSGTVHVYANTVADCSGTGGGNGYHAFSFGTYVLKNNIAFGNDDDYDESGTSFDAASTNNGYSEGTAPTSNDIDLTATAGTSIFTNYSSDDFSAKSGSAIDDAGADIDADVPDDHIGTTRHASTPTIGAFEAIAAATGNPNLLLLGVG